MLNVRRHARLLLEELEDLSPSTETHVRPRLPGWETGEDFSPWLEEITPAWNWRWPHLVELRKHLAAVTAGTLHKLMVFLPPRHGKSECTTVRYPAYRLERDPRTRIIVGAYSQTLADKFSRKSRRIVQGRIPLSNERTAVSDWETSKFGGVRAVGVGGGVTGQGGDLIIIDDPVKSREVADSQTFRDRVWDWYSDDLFTRREPGAAVILQMTRWHQDDLAGRILNGPDGPNWTVLSLAAFAEANDPLGRGKVACPACEGTGQSPVSKILCPVCEGETEVGAALCPERYDERHLADIKRTLGRSFYALYQQRPRPRDGALFKWGWFKPIAEPAADARRVRYWDTAGSEGRGDFTAGVLMSKTKDGLFTIEDVVRGQWSPAQKDKEIRAAADRDRQRWGQSAVTTWLEQEAGIGGKERTEATVRALAGHVVRYERVSGSKETRAEPLAEQAEIGNVLIIASEWNKPFLDELTDFPHGKHDDQVDAAAGALNKLATKSREVTTFEFRV